MSQRETRQVTFEGLAVPVLPSVRTSDGHIIEWDRNRIIRQLIEETKLVETFYGYSGASPEVADEIARDVETKIRHMGLKFLSGPLIREIVNITLLEKGMIQYRNVSTRVGTPVFDAHLIDVGRGFEAHDNANLQENAETSHKKKADKISKEQYLLQLPPELADHHLSGEMHIHDLEYFGTRPFCQDWDLRYFFYYGLMPDGNGTKASVAGPAKRAEVAILHAVKALGSAQTNFAGGQGYYNFLTFLAPYMEGLEYGEIKQMMQMFVYEMTQMMVARGGQLVFSSIQLSPGVPTLWKDKPCIYKGKVWDRNHGTKKRTYGEFEREVRLLFKALMDVMLEGDGWGKPFNFPKPEISIEPDFMNEDEEFNKANPDLPSFQQLYLMTFELASKFGTPYYDNQLPAYRGAGKGISCYQCCAYQFSAVADKDSDFDRKLFFEEGRHFSMGSWQVVSVNCPRAAYNAGGDNARLFAELKLLMDVAVEIFKIKRRWMDLIRANGRMPFAMQRPKDPNTGERGAVAVDLEGLVYTIGVVGVNEMVQHHTGSQLHESKEAFKLAIRAMTEMELYARELSQKNNMTIALARTPAETTGQRFAIADLLNRDYHDKALRVVKGDIDTTLRSLGRSRDLPIYYTNGTHVAPGANVPITKRMEIEHVFFPIVDGGNIFHIWLGEARPDPRGLMDMAMKLCRNTQIGYFAFTRDITVSLRQFNEIHSSKKTLTGWSSFDAKMKA
jgi:ribonucleoside-triphosphate reductase